MNILDIFAKGGPVVWILFTYLVVALMVISVIQSARKVSNRQLIN